MLWTSEGEVRKMSDNMFPEVVLSERKSWADIREERFLNEFPSMMHYLKKKCKGWSIADSIARRGAKNVILYALTDFTQIIADDIAGSGSGVTVTCICDRNAYLHPSGNYGFWVIGLEELEEMYRDGKFDLVLVSSVMHEISIVKDLLARGIGPEDIISVRDAVFYE